MDIMYKKDKQTVGMIELLQGQTTDAVSTMNKSLFIGVFASLVLCACAVSEPRRCDFYGNGSIVCEEQNLVGYYKCDGTDPFGDFHPCGSSQICSCGFNRRCPKDRSLCVDRPHFTSEQVPSDFTVSFNGGINISHPQGVSRELISGAVWVDSSTEGEEKQKLLLSHKRLNGREFERELRISMRKEDGTFVRYNYRQQFNESSTKEQVLHEFCTVSTISISDALIFYDLRFNTYKDPSRKDEYVFRNGPSFPQDGLTEKRWQFGTIHNTQPYVPVSFHMFQRGGPISKTSISFRVRNHFFYTGKPASDQFRIPDICNKQ